MPGPKKITMPAMYMRERGMSMGDTFAKFEKIATRSGIYTPADYVAILEDLLKGWDIEHLTDLSPAAAKAQDYLCNLPERYRKIVDRFRLKDADQNYRFSWLDLDAKAPVFTEL